MGLWCLRKPPSESCKKRAPRLTVATGAAARQARSCQKGHRPQQRREDATGTPSRPLTKKPDGAWLHQPSAGRILSYRIQRRQSCRLRRCGALRLLWAPNVAPIGRPQHRTPRCRRGIAVGFVGALATVSQQVWRKAVAAAPHGARRAHHSRWGQGCPLWSPTLGRGRARGCGQVYER